MLYLNRKNAALLRIDSETEFQSYIAYKITWNEEANLTVEQMVLLELLYHRWAFLTFGSDWFHAAVCYLNPSEPFPECQWLFLILNTQHERVYSQKLAWAQVLPSDSHTIINFWPNPVSVWTSFSCRKWRAQYQLLRVVCECTERPKETKCVLLLAFIALVLLFIITLSNVGCFPIFCRFSLFS